MRAGRSAAARASVGAILGFGRTVSDLTATETFYRDGLGFSRLAPPEPVPAAHRAAMGLDDGTATQLRMGLGAQTVTFLALDPPGAPYPAEPRATDPVFQHLAIPVRDMAAAMERLEYLNSTPISRGGPQELPLASGGVTAYKFRDPDGHPLELLSFPGGAPARRWRAAPGLFLGIDHSAITVTDLDAALTFLTGTLGLSLAARGLNRGPEQGRLDGVDDPAVDVIALEPPVPAPHVELLHYRSPATHRRTPMPFGPRDRATTCFVFSAIDPAAVAKGVRAVGFFARVSGDGAAAYAAGPDGHGMLFVRA